MSKFASKPYTELVLSELSGENKAVLLNFMNGKNAAGNADISYVHKNLAGLLAITDALTPVAYAYKTGLIWEGYLIKTTSYRVFITFHNGIDLKEGSVYNVASDGIHFKEYVTADYLRILLREDSYIDASEIEAALANVGAGTKLYKHTLRFSREVGPDEYENMDIDIISIRSTAYPDLSTITNDKNYEVLSYGYILPEDTPKQIIGFQDTGMESFLICYLSSNSINYIEVSDFDSDTVTEL